MSYPYPQDRHRDRKEKGEEPYKDAREALSQQEAALQAKAEEFGERLQGRSEEERTEDLEAEAEARLRAVGESRVRSQGSGSEARGTSGANG